MTTNNDKETKYNVDVTEEDVKLILTNCGFKHSQLILENYKVQNASNKMLGFLSDYWRLTVDIVDNNERKQICFFIKAVSRTNEAKANIVKELKLFEKELLFYTIIKRNIELPGLRPWSAKLITGLDDAMVFQDLNDMNYKLRNKFQRFDTEHTLQALQTLARFHASSLIFEENKSRLLLRPYRINEEFDHLLNKGGYNNSDMWFLQCMKGALEAIRTFSRYNNEQIADIESRWQSIWLSALELSDCSSLYRNVICHRDLWNNNILFHYKNAESSHEPDDCVLVDFQAVRYQPPAGDVMLLLYCNLNPKFREQNMEMFLDYYHHELNVILSNYGILIEDILDKDQFLASANEQRLWALVVCACLIPQFWVDDDLTTNIFCNTVQFENILTKDKASFIKKMMNANQNYRENVMEIFEELVERYVFNDKIQNRHVK